MEYWYAGSSTENTLPTYVDNLRQYLFDAKGNLLATITLKGDSVAGWNGNLPDGDYTLVLWGNLSDESNANETIQIQNENDMNMNEMTLSAQQTASLPDTGAIQAVCITGQPHSPCKTGRPGVDAFTCPTPMPSSL